MMCGPWVCYGKFLSGNLNISIDIIETVDPDKLNNIYNQVSFNLSVVQDDML